MRRPTTQEAIEAQITAAGKEAFDIAKELSRVLADRESTASLAALADIAASIIALHPEHLQQKLHDDFLDLVGRLLPHKAMRVTMLRGRMP